LSLRHWDDDAGDASSGQLEAVTEDCKRVLLAAFTTHPERFVYEFSRPPVVPEAAWINKPRVESDKVGQCKTLLIPAVTEYASG